MVRIDRNTGQVAALDDATALLALLVRVVAVFAQRLPVIAIPEQCLVAAMRDDVVDYGCSDKLTALEMIRTKRMRPKPSSAYFLPAESIASLCR